MKRASTDVVPLSAEDAAALQTGAEVRIVWAGGNGPHDYTVHRNKYGQVYAMTAWDLREEGLEHRSLPTHRTLTGAGSFVGRERFHTRVWLR